MDVDLDAVGVRETALSACVVYETLQRERQRSDDACWERRRDGDRSSARALRAEREQRDRPDDRGKQRGDV